MLGTAASILFKLDPGPIAPIAGLLVILTGALCIALHVRDWKRILALLSLSTLAELAGLFTGWPFGKYVYTHNWWPTVPIGPDHFFPLLLPFAWLMIVGGSWLTLRSFTSGWATILWTGLLAVLVDAPMERVMTDVFGYWKWAEPGPVFGAPILNSVGWFVVGCGCAAILEWGSKTRGSRYGWWVVGPFCIFAGISGLFRYFDWAFIVLLALGALFCTLRVSRREAAA